MFVNKFLFLKKIYSKDPYPNQVSINLTNKCNQRCIYCEIGQGKKKNDNPTLIMEDIEWIIQQMSKSNIFNLSLGGGEPFLFKDVFKVIEIAFQYKINCSIMTNGMFISKLSKEEIDILKKCNTKILISIDSFNEKCERKIRGTNNVSLPVDGIRKLVRKKIPVNLLTVITKINKDELFEVVKKAKNLEVNSVSLQPVIIASNYPETKPLDNKKSLNILPMQINEIQKQFDKIEEFQKTNNIRTNINLLRVWLPSYINFTHSSGEDFFFRTLFNKLYCSTLNHHINVNYHGKILPCNMLNSDISIKNRVRDNKSLIDMWNDACRPYRSMILKQKFPKICQHCVCDFDENLKFSVFRYPFKNFKTLIKLLNNKS